MTQKETSHGHLNTALGAAKNVLGVPALLLERQTLDDGLFWISHEGRGALVIFFRPTGITYENRPQTLEQLRRQQVGGVKLSYRYSLEKRRHGAGAGGLEIFAHEIRADHKPTSRLSLLVEETWDVLRIGKEVGSVGWFPRELSGILRPILYHHPYAFTHYSLWPSDQDRTKGLLRPNLYLCFVMWNVEDERFNYHKAELLKAYSDVYDRSNLFRWARTSMEEAWVIPPGYGGEIVDE